MSRRSPRKTRRELRGARPMRPQSPPLEGPAAVEAELERLAPRFAEMASEAMAKRATHILWALDPNNDLFVMLGGKNTPLARMRAKVARTGLALVPAEQVAHNLRLLADIIPEAGVLATKLLELPPPGTVRLLIQIKSYIALQAISFEPLSPGGSDEPDTWEDLAKAADLGPEELVSFKGKDGPVEGVTMRGFLKVMYAADPDRPGMRPAYAKLARQIQRIGKHAMLVEETKPSPRPLGDVLAEVFNVAALNDAIRDACVTGDTGAFERHMNAIIAARAIPEA